MTNNDDMTQRLIKAAASLKTAKWDPTKGRGTNRTRRTKRNNR